MRLTATVNNAPAGMGKTQLAAEMIANSNHIWEVYQPTHKLGDEWRDSILKYNPGKRVVVIKGRDALDVKGNPLCQRQTAAAQLTQAGLSVYPHLCRQSAGKGKAPVACPHYHTCAYIAQYQAADVYIYTHAHLPLTRSELETWQPHGVVIDESFFQSCLQKIVFPLALLKNPALPTGAAALCGDIHTGLLSVAATHCDYLFAKHHHSQGLMQAINALMSQQGAGLVPSMTAGQQTAVISQIMNVQPLIMLLKHLGQAFVVGAPIQSIDVKDGLVTVHHRRDITRLSAGGTPPKVFLLDASASQLVLDPFFDVGTIEPLRVARKAYVIQCHATRCSTSSLVPSKHKTAVKIDAAADRLQDVQHLINRLALRGLTGLVVGPSAITGNHKQNKPALLQSPQGWELAHFNALRGVDGWKLKDTIVLIGRNQPPAEAVEDIARGLFYDSPKRLTLTGQYTTAERGYRMAGGVGVGVDVQVHADSRVQAVLAQLREEESLQAIDRLRLLHATEERPVFVLSSVPLNLDVHQLASWKDITHGHRLEQAWARSNGVLPMSPAWLARSFPDLWATEKAAKDDVGGAAKRTENTNVLTIGKFRLFNHEYKSSKQKRWSHGLADTDNVKSVQQRLETLLGYRVTVKLLA